jgi:parallel beta-helix repeat protein
MKKLIFAFICLFLAIPSQAGIIYVDANATGDMNGVNWANAYNYLQDALSVAGDGNDIWVAEGTYKPAGPGGNRTATFQLISGVGIYGGYPSGGGSRDPSIYETILSGDLDGNDVDVNDPCDLLTEPTRGENSYHVVTGSGTDANAVFDGFTITSGNANGSGTDRYGGGMYNDSGSPTLTNCTFSDNSAYYYGGGMYNDSGSPTLTNCTFSGNSADYGGGMYNYGDSPTLTNCTFSGNSADYYGGGMYNYAGSNPAITNCTFSRNSADYGGGMYNFGSATLSNCILWGDTPQEVYGGAVITYSDVQGGWDGDGNIDVDPCFARPGYWNNNDTPGDSNDDFWVDGDYHLKSEAGSWDPNTETWVIDGVTSLCIDAGDPNADWTAELWPHGKRINIGVYGGTSEASMSLSDAGNIANLDNDPADDVDFDDLGLFVSKWLKEEILIPEDLDRDGVVNFVDYAIFAGHWLEGTSP